MKKVIYLTVMFLCCTLYSMESIVTVDGVLEGIENVINFDEIIREFEVLLSYGVNIVRAFESINNDKKAFKFYNDILKNRDKVKPSTYENALTSIISLKIYSDDLSIKNHLDACALAKFAYDDKSLSQLTRSKAIELILILLRADFVKEYKGLKASDISMMIFMDDSLSELVRSNAISNLISSGKEYYGIATELLQKVIFINKDGTLKKICQHYLSSIDNNRGSLTFAVLSSSMLT